MSKKLSASLLMLGVAFLLAAFSSAFPSGCAWLTSNAPAFVAFGHCTTEKLMQDGRADEARVLDALKQDDYVGALQIIGKDVGRDALACAVDLAISNLEKKVGAEPEGTGVKQLDRARAWRSANS